VKTIPRRPWRSYHVIKNKPWVKRWKKTKKGRREYVHGVPDAKIRMFTMGKNAEFDYEVQLIADEQVQISHLALEAARIAANRPLREKMGKEGYFLRILVYPHHVVREHRMMSFAGADRLQDGMRRAFGKPFATCARIRRDQKLMSIGIYKKQLPLAQRALQLAKMKFPRGSHLEVVQLKKLEEMTTEAPKYIAPSEEATEEKTKETTEEKTKETPKEKSKETPKEKSKETPKKKTEK
jgi:large subunit ribosomal protein L10e